MIDATTYSNLITSEHNQRPNFMAMIAAMVQGSVDQQNLLEKFPTLFDITVAVGDQLDKLGTWVGVSRNLNTSLTGGVTTLNDENYRTLLLAVIASNHWDGTVPGAYAIWAIVFAFESFQLLIQDNTDMSMAIIFLSSAVDNITLSLLTNGYISVRPAGVRISGYFEPSVGASPVFGFDAETAIISGFDVGSWATQIA